MRILLVVHDFFPNYFSGTEISTFELGKQLQKRGHKVLIFTTEPLGNGSYVLKEYQYKGLDCYSIDKNVRHYYTFEQSYNDLGTISSFKEILDKFKPDVIHYHHLMFFSTEFPLIVAAKNIPQIYTLHDFWIQCLTHKRLVNNKKVCYKFNVQKCAKCILDEMVDRDFEGLNFPRREIIQLRNNLFKIISYSFSKKFYRKLVIKRNEKFKELMKNIDQFIAPTPMIRDEFVNWGIDQKKIKFIDDGIQDEYFKNFQKRHPVVKDKIIFGFIGSIVPSKGLDLIIKTVREIDSDNVKLFVWGRIKNDVYGDWIKKMIVNDKRIAALGVFRADKIAEVFKKIDVLIVPSRWFENAPLVIKDSLLAKTPVIVTRVKGMTYLIKDGVNGFDFEINNVKELRDKMMEFISKKSLILEMSKRIKRPFTIKENVIKLEKLYNRLIKEGGKKK